MVCLDLEGAKGSTPPWKNLIISMRKKLDIFSSHKYTYVYIHTN